MVSQQCNAVIFFSSGWNFKVTIKQKNTYLLYVPVQLRRAEGTLKPETHEKGERLRVVGAQYIGHPPPLIPLHLGIYFAYTKHTNNRGKAVVDCLIPFGPSTPIFLPQFHTLLHSNLLIILLPNRPFPLTWKAPFTVL